MTRKAKQIKWNKEMLVASASNYQTRTAWAKGDVKAYDTAHRRGLLKECCGHMEGNTGQVLQTGLWSSFGTKAIAAVVTITPAEFLIQPPTSKRPGSI